MTERPTAQQQVVADRPNAGGRLRFKESTASGDFELVLAFSLIGLLIVLNLLFHFPELGAVIAQYNQF